MSWLGDHRRGDVARKRVAPPLARTDELIVEDLGDEILVYDQRSSEAHCLGREAAMVWRASDGATAVGELAAALSLEPEIVARSIAELEGCGLLDVGARLTRREAAGRIVRVGTAAAAAPLIYSIVAPMPALAASEATCFKICNTGCGSCLAAGCCCTAPGGGSNKLCSADLASCQALVPPFSHCSETITSTSCSAGC